MARPFDDRYSSQYASSAMSSQTSLAANRAWAATAEQQYPASSIYDEKGNIWKSKTSARSGKSVSKLAKIRSSPSQGALAAARASTNHEKIQVHKRGKSASVSESPASSTFDINPDPYDLKTPPSAYSDHYTISSPTLRGKSKVKIKPLLRKLSSNDDHAIDDSDLAAENEGLGIYSPADFGAEGKTSMESSLPRRGYHHRSNSQISTITTSSTHRYGTQYVHPMRQTPRPYTPPVVTSFQPSLDTDDSPSAGIPTTLDTPHSDSFPQRPSFAGSSSYAPLPSARRQPPPLHVHTHSSSRLTSSSQTNLPGTPASLRQHSDHKPTTDNMFASTRSSFETFRQRSRANTANTTNNPAETAATVADLRRKFNEKQEAKEAKYHEAAVRQEAKEYAKRQKREESERRKSEGKERKRARSNAASEKTVTMGEYDNAPTLSFVPGSTNQEGQRRRGGTGASAGKAVHSQWQLFWFKLKTAWIRFKRRMSGK